MYRSLTFISAICASFCISPVFSQAKIQSSLAEDAASFEFLRGSTVSSKIKSYCLNMQLRQVGESARFAMPLNEPKSPKTQEFLRDLEIVSANGAALPAREIEAASLRSAGFNVRAATFEECAELPTVRLYRPMINKNRAVVFAHLITKCGSTTTGENFHLNRKKWERRHLAHYYPVVGLPGCSQMSKVVPGNPTDKLVILDR